VRSYFWPFTGVQNGNQREVTLEVTAATADQVTVRFFDNAHRRHTGLAHYLEKRSIKEIYLMGLALDYCVKYSALDARELGLAT
jgi:nicotinamidase/pyrazinamidase